MTRRYTPGSGGDGDGLAAVLAGRVDALETALGGLQSDVAAVGRGVTDLTTQIRHLTTTTTTTSSGNAIAGSSAGDGGAQDGEDGQAQEPEEGQLDWFAVDDPDQAAGIITALAGWADTILTYYGLAVPVPCWVLHPAVVADLIALDAERAAAYSSPNPTPVSEFLARWLPATRDRITADLNPCAVERGHRQDGITYDTTGFDPLSAAAWWATSRATPAPQAFALPEFT